MSSPYPLMSGGTSKRSISLPIEFKLYFLVSPDGEHVEGPFAGTYPQDTTRQGWTILSTRANVIGKIEGTL